ncbi:MAG: hypothetical protein HOE90_22385 [Bacteriovoracaceae bacterium]|jgi:hypothetical protein|nr:hypothetical protein [Bacteriovoracaceae bacterium]
MKTGKTKFKYILTIAIAILYSQGNFALESSMQVGSEFNANSLASGSGSLSSSISGDAKAKGISQCAFYDQMLFGVGAKLAGSSSDKKYLAKNFCGCPPGQYTYIAKSSAGNTIQCHQEKNGSDGGMSLVGLFGPADWCGCYAEYLKFRNTFNDSCGCPLGYSASAIEGTQETPQLKIMCVNPGQANDVVVRANFMNLSKEVYADLLPLKHGKNGDFWLEEVNGKIIGRLDEAKCKANISDTLALDYNVDSSDGSNFAGSSSSGGTCMYKGEEIADKSEKIKCLNFFVLTCKKNGNCADLSGADYVPQTITQAGTKSGGQPSFGSFQNSGIKRPLKRGKKRLGNRLPAGSISK